MKLKAGELVQNKYKQWTKIVAIKAGFVYFCGWHLKKTEADKRDNAEGQQPLNVTAFSRLLEGEVTPVEDASKTDGDDTNTGGDDDGKDVVASDAVKTYAKEQGIDLTEVKGTGKDGAVVKKDVEAIVKERKAALDAMVDYTVKESDDLEMLNSKLPDGAEPLKVGDVIKLDPEHELLKGDK